MLMLLSLARRLSRMLLTSEKAQDAFEYVLIVGGVTVVLVGLIGAAVSTSLGPEVIYGVCQAVDGVVGTVECTDPSPPVP